MKLRPILAAAFLVPLAGCVTAELTRVSAFREPEAKSLTRLTVGESELGDCLDALGAPLFVSEEGDGAVLAWGWFDASSWGVGVSVPISSDYSASFNYTDLDAALQGVVLFFDVNWTLVELRSGYLRDILGRRKRPQDVD